MSKLRISLIEILGDDLKFNLFDESTSTILEMRVKAKELINEIEKGIERSRASVQNNHLQQTG